MKNHLPVDCVIALTYRCNSRCVMCDIWKIKDYPEFTPDNLRKLPKTLRDINLSGGEPFLRRDLPEIVKILTEVCPRARIVISSNGFATDLILKQMKEILKIKSDIGVAISIDGIGSIHDEMRGIPGGYEKALATIRLLKKMGMTNLRLAFTLGDKNANQLKKVYNLACDLDVQFTHSFAQSSEFYFGGKQNVNLPRQEIIDEQYNYLIKKELSSWNFKRWLRAYFAFAMRAFILNKTPELDSAPGRDFFFLDPSGDVYPSVAHNVILGNLHNIESLESFWLSVEIEEKRKKVDELKMPVWMMCTARSAMRRHPLAVLWWVFKNKIYANSVGK